MNCVTPPGLGQVGKTLVENEGQDQDQDQIIEHSHSSGGVADFQTIAAFRQGHIATVMQAVFNASVGLLQSK